jgi:hypothetical protein
MRHQLDGKAGRANSGSLSRRGLLFGMAALGAATVLPEFGSAAQSGSAAPACPFRIDTHHHFTVPKLIAEAEKHEVWIDTDYVERYIAARQKLTTDAGDETAQKTVRHFKLLMSTFGQFTLPSEDWDKYCQPPGADSRNIVRRDTFLARVVDLNPYVVAKCQQAKVFRPKFLELYGMMGTEGIRGFKQRTGLLDEQILAMNLDELRAHA